MPVFFENLPALLYFSLFLILLFLSGAVYLYGNKKNDYFVLFFSFAIAILFHGTRAPDATDLSV
ncbi:EpsG family protein, partial [Escherichia coli]